MEPHRGRKDVIRARSWKVISGKERLQIQNLISKECDNWELI